MGLGRLRQAEMGRGEEGPAGNSVPSVSTIVSCVCTAEFPGLLDINTYLKSIGKLLLPRASFGQGPCAPCWSSCRGRNERVNRYCPVRPRRHTSESLGGGLSANVGGAVLPPAFVTSTELPPRCSGRGRQGPGKHDGKRRSHGDRGGRHEDMPSQPVVGAVPCLPGWWACLPVLAAGSSEGSKPQATGLGEGLVMDSGTRRSGPGEISPLTLVVREALSLGRSTIRGQPATS